MASRNASDRPRQLGRPVHAWRRRSVRAAARQRTEDRERASAQDRIREKTPKEDVPSRSGPREGTMTARVGASMQEGIKSSMPCNNLQKISHNNQPTDKTERAMMDEEELAGNSGKGCGYVGSAVGGEHIAAFFDSCRVVGTYTPGKAIDENMAWSQQHPRGPWMYRCIHASMHSCTHASMHGCMDAWMHPCMDEWMHGCTHAWMHGCIHACINYCMVACFLVHGCIRD